MIRPLASLNHLSQRWILLDRAMGSTTSHFSDLQRPCLLWSVLRVDSVGQAVPVGDDGVASWASGAARVEDEGVSVGAHCDGSPQKSQRRERDSRP